MNDEIKEILDKLNKMIIFDKVLIGWQIDGNGATISKKDFKILLDYITNLQEELKSANESITWWHNRFNAKNNGFKSTIEELCETTEQFEKLQEKYEKMKENAEILSKGYNKLEKENEILKENAIHNDKVVDKAKWNEMLYKSIIDKAINCINHYAVENEDYSKIYNDEEKDLLNILQGDDK